MSVLAVKPGSSGDGQPGKRGLPGRGRGWQSLTTISRRWVAAAFVACALYAGGVALFTGNSLHRFWGASAAISYLLAAVAALAWRSRGLDVALVLSLCGTLLVPLGWMAAVHKMQPEVWVITNSARMLVHHGTPYASTATLAHTTNSYLFDPYLPVMTLFGLPRALAGQNPVTDPRIWFGLTFVLAFGLAFAVAGAKDWIRWTAFVTASPVIAFELAVGGTDIPVLALMCLGMALLWRRHDGDGGRPVLAGLALGVAAAMKATAWPALVIAIALLAVRDGKRAAGSFTLSAAVTCAALIGPVAAVWPGALVVNTISFPLGLTNAISAAASPLPGHLLAGTGHIGHLIAVVLLALSGLGIAASLLLIPPKDVPSATWRLILGLALMFTLAPATRFGYYLYPAGLLVWLLVASIGRRIPPEPELI
ncbi:MAG TPA: glycosyltransferase 87 family protein [Streptosporangiaceae bacterium]